MYNQHEHDALRRVAETYQQISERRNPLAPFGRAIGGTADWIMRDTTDFDGQGSSADKVKDMPKKPPTAAPTSGKNIQPKNRSFKQDVMDRQNIKSTLPRNADGKALRGQSLNRGGKKVVGGGNSGTSQNTALKGVESKPEAASIKKAGGDYNVRAQQGAAAGSRIAASGSGGTQSTAKPKSQLTHGKFSNAEYDRLRNSGQTAAADKYGKQMHKSMYNKPNMSTDRAKPLTPSVPTPKPAVKPAANKPQTSSINKTGASMTAAKTAGATSNTPAPKQSTTTSPRINAATSGIKAGAGVKPTIKSSYEPFGAVKLFEEEKKKGTYKRGREKGGKTKTYKVNVIARGSGGRTELIQANTPYEAKQIAKSRFGNDRIGSVNTQPRQYKD